VESWNWIKIVTRAVVHECNIVRKNIFNCFIIVFSYFKSIYNKTHCFKLILNANAITYLFISININICLIVSGLLHTAV
jgi:hypothetical protein